MPLADVLLTALVVALVPVCFWQPWIGVLAFSWIGYMNPHRLMHGFAYTMPFAKMVAIPTLLGLLRTKDRAALPRTREVYLLFALWVTFLLSTFLTAAHPALAREAFAQVSKVWLMTVVTLLLFQDRSKLRWLLFVIALSIGYFGVTGGVWAILTRGQERLYGPPASAIGDNNDLGFALTLVLPLLVYLRSEEVRPWLRHILLATFGVSLVAIAATYSRGASLGLGVVLVVVFVKTRLKDRGLLFATLVAAAVVSLAPAQWFERIASIPTAYRQDPSGIHRLTSWYVAWRVGLDHPILGAGFRPFAPYVYEHYIPGYSDYHDAHNHFLQVLAEHGFTGLVLFIALIASVFVTLRRTIRATRGDPHQRWIYHYSHGVEVSLIAYVVGGLFLNRPYFDLFYHLVAIAILLEYCRVAGPRSALALERDGITEG